MKGYRRFDLNAGKIQLQRLRTRCRKSEGQVLLLFAAALPLLLAMLGLVLDGGRLFFEKRHAQIAADAGARSAAFELLRGNSLQSEIDEASQTDARLNGYDDTATGTSVAALIGPTGYSNNFVQVTVSKQVPTTLMKIFSKDFSTVAARAIAGIVPDTTPPCVLALNPTASGGLTMNGNATLNAECKVMVNSNSPASMVQNGSGACVNAHAIGYVAHGSHVGSGGLSCFNPTPAGQAIVDADPYDDLTPPDPASLPLISNPMVVINEGNVAAQSPMLPGYYRRGIFVSSTISISLDMNPGVYLVDGFSATGNVTLRGTDITIIDICGPGPLSGITIAGTVDAQLSAPDSGPWKNILFYSLCPDASMLTGNATTTFEGVMYFPNANITFGGNQGATATWGMIIADTITFNGNPNLTVDYAGSSRTPDRTTIGLVE